MLIEYGDRVSEIDGEYWELNDLRAKLNLDPEDASGADQLMSTDEGQILSGLIPLVSELLDDVEVEYPDDLIRAEVSTEDLVPLFKGIVPYDYQIAATKKMLLQGRGLVELPTGSGKTEIAAAATRWYTEQHGLRVLFLSGSALITTQGRERFLKRGVPEVGIYHGDEKDLGPDVVSATIQSLYSGIKKGDERVVDLLDSEVLIVDEVHHLPAKMWTTVMSQSKARYRFGLSATVFDEPGEYSIRDLVLIGLTGPVLIYVPLRVLIQRGILPEPIIYIARIRGDRIKSSNWDKVYKLGIVESEEGNDIIAKIAGQLSQEGTKSLTFVNRVTTHAHQLLPLMQPLCTQAAAYSGGGRILRYVGDSKVDGTWDLETLREYINLTDGLALVATSVLDEGVDIPDFGAVIMGGGLKKARRVVQRIGRAMRKEEGSESPGTFPVFDFIHESHFYLQRHSEKRIQLYKDLGLQVRSITASGVEL